MGGSAGRFGKAEKIRLFPFFRHQPDHGSSGQLASLGAGRGLVRIARAGASGPGAAAERRHRTASQAQATMGESLLVGARPARGLVARPRAGTAGSGRGGVRVGDAHARRAHTCALRPAERQLTRAACAGSPGAARPPPGRCRKAARNQGGAQAPHDAPGEPVGLEAVQEGSPRHAVQVQPVWRLVALQGHCAREDWHRGQAAQLGDPEVRARAAHQERQEDCRVRPQRWLLELRRRERARAPRAARLAPRPGRPARAPRAEPTPPPRPRRTRC